MSKYAQNVLCMQSMFLGIGISSLINNTHEFVFLSIIIGTIFGFILIKIFNFNSNNKISSCLCSIILLVITLIINVNMVSVMYLDNVPKFILGLPIILLLIYLITKKDITTFKISSIILYINLFLVITACIFLFPHIRFNNFYISNVNITNIIKSSIDYSVYSITPILLIDNRKHVYKSYIISTILILMITFCIYGILGCNLTSIYRYPEYIVLKKISISSSLENLENIISFHWIFNIFILMATCTNKLKQQINNNLIVSIILLLILVFSTLINQHFINIYFFYNNLSYILIIILIILFFTNKKTC